MNNSNISRLNTPLGDISVLFDGKEVTYQYFAIPKNPRNPDIKGYFAVYYSYETDHRKHKLRFIIKGFKGRGEPKSGERLETVEFFRDDLKLSMGIEAEFVFDQYTDYDYNGECLSNGIEIDIREKTKSKVFKLGIAWIQPVTEANEWQTMYAVDPFIFESKD